MNVHSHSKHVDSFISDHEGVSLIRNQMSVIGQKIIEFPMQDVDALVKGNAHSTAIDHMKHIFQSNVGFSGIQGFVPRLEGIQD